MKNCKDNILYGVKIGEHSSTMDELIGEIKERVIEKGYNLTYFRPSRAHKITNEEIVKIAGFLAENKIYFHFGYNTGQTPRADGCLFVVDGPMVKEINALAGEYFLGFALSEASGSYACKGEGYFAKREGRSTFDPSVQKTDATDMKDAHAYYCKSVSSFVEKFREMGIPKVFCIDQTAVLRFNLESGVEIPILELMCGEPDIMLSATRGSCKAYNGDFWGALIAHEWYGGVRHSDVLKRKRFELASKLAYIAGAKSIELESGDEAIASYGDKYSRNSEFCSEYRNNYKKTFDFIKSDERPCGGPKVKLAFVFGKYDAWTGFGQSSLFNQFKREEWGHGDAEYSWRFLDALGTKRKWGDNSNYGDNDLSSCPVYGTYDIVPIEADVDILSKYETLIFLGWNTMTDENLDKLTEYVRRGGRLLLGAAHLNYSAKRKSEYIPPSKEKVEALCGCRFTDETVRTNYGTKFSYDSLDDKTLYPGSKSFIIDPLFSAGYTDYIKTEPTTAKVIGYASDSFWNDPPIVTTVLENKVGNGVVTLVTSKDYPGNPAISPLYNTIARELVSSSARNCDVKVIGSEKLRYTVYENNKIYLVNTDYDLPIVVKIIFKGIERTVTLDTLELKALYLDD